MTPPTPFIEIVDEDMARVLRQKSGAERLHIANGLFVFARRMIQTRLRIEHPDWSAAQVDRETARRISHGTV